jgi:hypothetical protein
LATFIPAQFGDWLMVKAISISIIYKTKAPPLLASAVVFPPDIVDILNGAPNLVTRSPVIFNRITALNKNQLQWVTATSINNIDLEVSCLIGTAPCHV